MKTTGTGWHHLRLTLAGAFLAMALYFLVQGMQPRVYQLQITGGDSLGRRHTLARLLAKEARAHRLQVTVTETRGSEEALALVRNGTLYAALVQGGLPVPENIRLVAALSVEPLHLLLKKEIAAQGLNALKGRRVNLSTEKSGTRHLAKIVLDFIGLKAGRDFTDEDRPYTQLEALSYKALPDAVFMVSSLPSPVAEFLIRQHGYRLVPLPFAEALGLQDGSIFPAAIPAYTYGAFPPAPAETIPTPGNRLLLIANRDAPPEAIYRLLETILQTGFLTRANLPSLDEERILAAPELPPHPGALSYLQRNSPLLRSDTLQSVESLRSFLVSAVIGLYLAWRALVRRRYQGFDNYLTEVTELEKRVQTIEASPSLDVKSLVEIRNRLSALKTEALEKFARGELRGEELMTGFLAHVADVRSYLNSLILHERERIAEQSTDTIPDEIQEARFQKEWSQALGDS